MPSERVRKRIEGLLDRADEAADRNEWPRVIELCEDVLTIDPENQDGVALLKLARRRSVSDAQTPDPEARPPGKPAREDKPSETYFAGDRYRVKKFLGEGGKKKVYLAHDSLLDRDVAFALIKSAGLDETGRQRVTREAQAMGRLGSHPHVVTVFDLGQHDGQPYMVTELMSGGDLEGVLRRAGKDRLPVSRVIELGIAVCRGLEFAHAARIVHRDLKPGNVWLTGDGVPKIGDFGLAVATDRSRLTREAMIVGTVAYMPPEQAVGGPITPQSDLYSLGAMLYEMIAGRPPFLGDEDIAVISQHVNTPPVAPGWHNTACPRPLEALVLRLLAKDPADRPRSATDTRVALEAIDPTTDAVEHSASSHRMESLAGGVFVGRQREMDSLRSALEDALAGRGRMIAIVGEPGIGKTTIASELATYASLRRVTTLWGRCYEGPGMPPCWPWVQVIRAYLANHEPDQVRRQLGACGPVIAKLVPDLATLLPELLSEPPLSDPDAARFRLFDALTTFLRAIASDTPLLVILDDSQWSDSQSLAMLEFLAGEIATSRLLVVFTYRDDALSRGHPLAHTLGDLARAHLFHRIALKGLRKPEVGRFIEVASGISPPAELVDAVFGQTEGNPFFVTEVVRLLVQEGDLARENFARVSRWTVRIPVGVRDVVARRLAGVSEAASGTLTLAAVLGREFTAAQVTALTARSEANFGRDPGMLVSEALEEAASARLIDERRDVAGTFQFTHGLVRQSLYEDLNAVRRSRLHGEAALALESLYGDRAVTWASELVHHLVASGRSDLNDRLARYSRAAAETAIATYAYDDASAHFKRALDVTPEPVDENLRAELLFGLGRAQAGAANAPSRPAAIETLRNSFDLFMKLGRHDAAAMVAEAAPLAVPGTSVAPLVEGALNVVPGGSLAAGRLLCRLVRARAVERGDYSSARLAVDEALTIARREGDRSLEIRVLAEAASAAGWNLYLDEAREFSTAAIDLARAVNEPPAQWLALSHLWKAVSLLSFGEPADAAVNMGSCMTIAERLRDRYLLGASSWINQVVPRLQGDWSLARQLSDLEKAAGTGEPRLIGDRVLVELETGTERPVELIEALVRMTSRSPAGPYIAQSVPALVIPIVARISGKSEHADVAAAAADGILASPIATRWIANMARVGKSLAALETRNAPAAATHYRTLIEIAENFSDGDPTVVVGFSLHRLLGLLADLLDDHARSRAHFEDAITFLRRAGYRAELAWTCSDYAEALGRRGTSGSDDKSKTRVTELHNEAIAIARQLKMQPLLSRLLSQRQILKA